MVCILYVITNNVVEPSEPSATPAVTQRPPSSRVSGIAMVRNRIPEALTQQRSSKTDSAERRSIAPHLYTTNVANVLGNLPSPAAAVKTADASATKASEGLASDGTHSPRGHAIKGHRSSFGQETESIYSTSSVSPQQHEMLLRQINQLLSLPPTSLPRRPLPQMPSIVVHRTVDAKSSTLTVPNPFVEPTLATIYSHPYDYNLPRGDPRAFGGDDPDITTSTVQHPRQASHQLSPVHAQCVPIVRPEDWRHRTPASSVGPSAPSVSLLSARQPRTNVWA